MVRILDFIPSAMGSLWRVLTGERCDQFTFSKDHSAMWKSDLVKQEKKQGDQWGSYIIQ